MTRALAILVVLGACAGDVDPQWQLDHDRVIAVRATPPGVVAQGRSELDALLGYEGDHPREALPELATVVSPQSLAGALTNEANHWIVTAPDEAQLAAVRAELGLPADAPVPLLVGVSFAGGSLPAIKTVYLGQAAVNPVLDSVMVNGSLAATTAELIVAIKVDVPLAIEAADTDDVNWLTSCGTMHDFDLPAGYLRVEPADPLTGDLAVVIRTELGGVAWRVWPIRAE